jgi:hypothetical protein
MHRKILAIKVDRMSDWINRVNYTSVEESLSIRNYFQMKWAEGKFRNQMHPSEFSSFRRGQGSGK